MRKKSFACTLFVQFGRQNRESVVLGGLGSELHAHSYANISGLMKNWRLSRLHRSHPTPRHPSAARSGPRVHVSVFHLFHLCPFYECESRLFGWESLMINMCIKCNLISFFMVVLLFKRGCGFPSSSITLCNHFASVAIKGAKAGSPRQLF